MNKRTYYKILNIITLAYLAVITFQQNPLKENYSMMSSSFLGYISIFGLCIFLSLSFIFPTLELSKKHWYLALGPIVGCLFPYTANKGDLLSNIHEVCAYISFGMCVLLMIINIYHFQQKTFHKRKTLLNIFTIILFLDAVLYLETMGVVGLEEFILLSTMVIINDYMYYKNSKQ